MSPRLLVPLLSLTVLATGCMHAGGEPALRPHARVAAERAPGAAWPVPEATVDVSGASEDGSGGLSTAPAATAAVSGWEVADLTATERLYPLSGFRADAIISRFGDSRDGGGRRHEGIDIRAPKGTPILAPFAGRVIASGQRSRSGNMVVLLAEDGRTELFFAHMQDRDVERGQRVHAGQRLGTVGDTGNARGTVPHLHFEVRIEAGPVDPYPWLMSGSSAATLAR